MAIWVYMVHSKNNRKYGIFFRRKEEKRTVKIINVIKLVFNVC